MVKPPLRSDDSLGLYWSCMALLDKSLEWNDGILTRSRETSLHAVREHVDSLEDSNLHKPQSK